MPKHKSLQPESKTAKPYPDHPLSYHKGSGQWCENVRGKVHYFGTGPNAALDKWLADKDYLLAGRERPTTRAATPGGVTVRELCNRFLHAFSQRVESGKRSACTWKAICKRMVI
jgi:hypothetical protein